MSDKVLHIGILGDPRDVHVRRWCAGLAGRGLEVCNICGRTPARRVPGVAYLEFQVPGFGLRHPYRRTIRFRRRFQAIFRQFDVVHVHNLQNWGLDEEVVSCGRLMISTYGDDVLPQDISFDPEQPLIDRDPHTAQMKKASLALADHITATSDLLADATAAYGDVPRDEIEVIHFGVDPGIFAPTGASKPQTGRVAFLGGFRACKGAAELIDSAPLVWERFPSCTFEMYGQGHSRPECEATVADRGHQEGIRFHDFVAHHELPRVLGTFDLLAIPSIYVQESYCVVAVEAQAMELPVVASRIGGLLGTVRHGQTGLLVEPASPRALAEGLCELLGDPDRCRLLGRAGRQWVIRAHNWSHNLDQMILAYRRVVEGYSRRAGGLGLGSGEPALTH